MASTGGFGALGGLSAPSFGTAATAPASQPPSLFGAPSASQPPTSLFGGTSLFGPSATAAATTAAAPQSTQPLFAPMAPAQSTPSLFTTPASIAPPATTTAQTQFGLPSQPAAQPWASPAQATALAAPGVPPGVPPGLQSILEAYNPRGAYCRFRHMFYNVVDPETVHLYQRPAGTDERLWEQALRNNPDPSRLVPVQAAGFEDLQVRVGQQEARISQHLGALGQLEESVRKLAEDNETVSKVKLAEYRRRHRELVRKLMRVSFALERIFCRGRHTNPEEMALRRRVEAMVAQLGAPGQFLDKLADLEDTTRAAAGDKGRTRASGYVEPLDSKSAGSLKSLLSGQLDGISHLMDELVVNERDASILIDGYTNLLGG